MHAVAAINTPLAAPCTGPWPTASVRPCVTAVCRPCVLQACMLPAHVFFDMHVTVLQVPEGEGADGAGGRGPLLASFTAAGAAAGDTA